MRILLVRHGESQSNCDTKIHTIIPDHEISLSSRGFEQAEYAGECLKAFFEKTYADILDKNIPLEKRTENLLLKDFKMPSLDVLTQSQKPFPDMLKDLVSQFSQQNGLAEARPKIKLYHSPYRRTRETTTTILKSIKSLVQEVKEDVLLIEELHGLFDGLSDEEMEQQFPTENKLFRKTEKNSGKFYARYPHGESPFDVACRLRTFFQSLKEDEENGISDTIIIMHGITIKVFVMAYLNKSPEWYENEKSPGNCSIRILENNKDLGYVHGGYRDGKIWNYNGNNIK